MVSPAPAVAASRTATGSSLGQDIASAVTENDHGTSAPMLSYVAHVAADIIGKIRLIECVDLSSLLPHLAEEPSAKRFRMDPDGAFSVCPPQCKTIENLQAWLEAWSVFSLIAVREFPRCAETLPQHQLRIVQAASKFKFAAVMGHNTKARQALAGDPQRSIRDLDPDLYAMCFTGQALPVCASCKKVGHVAANCNFRGKSQQGQQVRG